MTKLGIIGAMQVEVEILLGQMENRQDRTIAGSIFYEGRLEGLDVVVVQCGVGKVNVLLNNVVQGYPAVQEGQRPPLTCSSPCGRFARRRG